MAQVNYYLSTYVIYLDIEIRIVHKYYLCISYVIWNQMLSFTWRRQKLCGNCKNIERKSFSETNLSTYKLKSSKMKMGHKNKITKRTSFLIKREISRLGARQEKINSPKILCNLLFNRKVCIILSDGNLYIIKVTIRLEHMKCHFLMLMTFVKMNHF